jgi:hypothetical protein
MTLEDQIKATLFSQPLYALKPSAMGVALFSRPPQPSRSWFRPRRPSKGFEGHLWQRLELGLKGGLKVKKTAATGPSPFAPPLT